MISVTVEAPAAGVTLSAPGLDKELRKEIQAIKKVRRELLSNTAKRRQFLKAAGILGRDGKLAKKYR